MVIEVGRVSGRAGEGHIGVGGLISHTPKAYAPPPRALKGPRRRAGYQVSLPPYRAEISSNPVNIRLAGWSKLIA